jgi:ankyrin repeat protein
MDQSLALIFNLAEAIPDHVRKNDKNGSLLLQWAAKDISNAAVIAVVLKTYPEAAREKDEDGCLPLHWAAWKNSNAAVILELLKAYPDAAREKGKDGCLPLHWAAWKNSNAAVIAELLRAYPEAAREKNEFGSLPLHWAALNNSNAAVIAELLKAYPEAAREKDKYGSLPLHVAVENNSNVAVIAELLKAYPEAAREKDGGGRLPLHFALGNNSNAAVILELLEAYPEAAREKDEFGSLPLHWAAKDISSVAVIFELLKAYPEAAREKDEDGRLPLHWAAWKNSNAAVIFELLKAYPEAAREKNEFERLPLHWAAKCNSNAAVISELLRAYPEAAREKDEDGRLPLHWAAKCNSNAAVISELLRAYPEAARENGEGGLLPLHLALEEIVCGSNSNAAVISELLRAYPQAACEKDEDGRLPLHVAVKKDFQKAVIAELLKAYPEAAREKDKDGRLPLHFALGNKSNAAVIAELLKAYPEAAREKDQKGRLPLHAAVEDLSNKDSNAAVIVELLKADPDALLVVDDEAKHKCLSVLSQAGDLPCSVIKSSAHPLQACIKLSSELMAFSLSQRSTDIRLTNDADKNAAELEQLACAIARNCKDSSHFGQAMDDCLQLAADVKLKFFISEPACSRRIEQLWWTNETFTRLLGHSLFWISGLNLVFNHNQWVPPPLVRFLMNRSSYFAFLVCLFQLPILDAPSDPIGNIGFEVFLAYWLFDICFSETIELLDIMKQYRLTYFKAIAKWANPSNVYDFVTVSTAAAAFLVRGLVYAGVGNATAFASNQLYAWALALLWGRLVNLLSSLSFVGPLLIMVLAMVLRDLSKFALLVVLMELPFVTALNFLESGEGGNEAFATFPRSALSFFKIAIGEGPEISSVTATSSILLSVGSVLLSVLLLNLLIAMFSKTFDTIVENSTQEFLLQKAQLTFTWARAPRMPPPLACILALRDWAMNMVAKRMWRNRTFRQKFAGWVYNHGDYVERVEPPPPTFDKNHFYEIVFPRKIDSNTKREHEENPAKREEWSAQWMQECEAKYEAWCEQVLADFNENAEFNSEAQMDKFKSRMLRGMETTVESSGEIKQIAENAKATQEQVKFIQEQGNVTQEQVKALSDAIQSHATQEQVKALSVAIQSHATQEQVKFIQEQGNVTQEQVKALSDAIQSHATQEQVKALSDAIQSQNAQMQQMQDSLQLILQKLHPYYE